jgi:hypothetical protein
VLIAGLTMLDCCFNSRPAAVADESTVSSHYNTNHRLLLCMLASYRCCHVSHTKKITLLAAWQQLHQIHQPSICPNRTCLYQDSIVTHTQCKRLGLLVQADNTSMQINGAS